MNVEFTKKDPENEQEFIESECSRKKRQRQLGTDYKPPADVQVRSDEIAAKRAERLDAYFSQHPPNGPMISIYREALAAFVNTAGGPPQWLTYPWLSACFDRLEKKGILKVEMTEDKFNVRRYKSEVTADVLACRRNVRPAELDALISQLKDSLGGALQHPFPAVENRTIRGCRQVTMEKWRVSLYFGGAQRALGCYPFATAVRLQDALAYYFSSYRRPGYYNTSEAHACEVLLQHPAVLTFCTELKAIWLSAGILVKPGTLPVDKDAEWKQTIESRLAVIESHLKIVP